jgi:hypothetical protein
VRETFITNATLEELKPESCQIENRKAAYWRSEATESLRSWTNKKTIEKVRVNLKTESESITYLVNDQEKKVWGDHD